jgi:hypothetical protein
MTTVKLYYNKQTKAYLADEVGEGWSLRPCGNNTEFYESETVEEADFILPEGYRVGRDQTDIEQIYLGDEYCPLITDGNKVPRLCSSQHQIYGLPLKKVRKE